MAPSVYANNFVKREINITLCTMHQPRKIQKRNRTRTTCKTEFFVTLVIGRRFAASYSFFRIYILSKAGMIKLLKKSLDYVRSLWTRCLIKKTLCANIPITWCHSPVGKPSLIFNFSLQRLASWWN